MEYQPGNVLLWKNTTWIDKAIRIWDFLKYGRLGYSHSSIIIGQASSTEYIVAEEDEKNFTISNYAKSYFNSKIAKGQLTVKTANVPLDLDLLSSTAHKWLGTLYGYFEDFEDVFNFKISDGLLSMNCSEAVSRLLYVASGKNLDLSKEFKKDFDFITPTDISMSKQLS